VADLVAAGVEAGVPPMVRQTVKAVAAIIAENPSLTETKEVNQSELAERLKLDKAAVSRRVSECLARGYLRNLEERKSGRGRPVRLVLGDKLPTEQDILPDPVLVDQLIGCERGTETPDSSTKGNGAGGRHVCVQCGQPEDDPRDPLTEHRIGDLPVLVHRICERFWADEGRPTKRPSTEGWAA
jgi:hypothetical protein